MVRKNISKTIRFEVFKRDKFTCQYCGRAAPDVVLQADHIIRSIARNRCYYFNEWEGLGLLERAYLAGCDVDELRSIALGAHNWTSWSSAMEEQLAHVGGAR